MNCQTRLAKKQIFMKDWSKFIQPNFVLDYFDKDWSDVFQPSLSNSWWHATIAKANVDAY